MIHRALIFMFLCSTFVASAQFWTQSSSNFPLVSTGASKFHAVNANVAWATGYDGIAPNNNIQRFTTTGNAGASWTAGVFNLGNTNLGISNVSGVNATTAFVSAYPRAAGDIGGVWKTTDTGITWTRQMGAAFNSATSFTNLVHFFNANEGVVIGDPVNNFWEIYVTANGGTAYTRLPASNIPVALAGETGYIAQFTYVGDSIWFSTSRGRIYHSANKGITWNVYQSPLNDLGGVTVYGDYTFTNATQGMLQDNFGNLWRTFDSGATWSLVNISGTGNPYGDAIAYLPGTSQLISTGARTNFSGSAYSLDNGTTWVNIDNIQHVDIVIFNENTAYSGGFSSAAGNTGIFKYTAAVLSNTSQELEAAFNIYPNPVVNDLFFETRLDMKQFQILAMDGTLIKQHAVTDAIPVSDLATGVYILQVHTPQGLISKYFIKE